MTKEFKSALQASNMSIVVQKGSHERFIVEVGGGIARSSVALDASDAPALALAILEAAGITSADGDFDKQVFGGPAKGAEYAVMWLRHLAEHQTTAAKEAADRAVLWQEASDLYHSVFPDNPTFATPDQMPEHLRDGWVRAALKAREIHGAGDE